MRDIPSCEYRVTAFVLVASSCVMPVGMHFHQWRLASAHDVTDLWPLRSGESHLLLLVVEA